MRKFRLLARFWLPPLGWMGLIFFISSFPTGRASHIDWQDFAIKKTIHIFEYVVLFTLLYRGLKNLSSLPEKKAAFMAFLLTFLYAASDEFHQTFTQGREGTPRDVLIDSLGALLAWWGIWKYLPKAPAKLKNWAKKLQII
ncbi:MAG: VanZ family protein [Patescibacteria group bacterium]